MAKSFHTSDEHPQAELKPLRVAALKQGVYEEAKNMVADLAGWTLVEADDQALRLVCTRKGGLLSGESTILIAVEGPDGIPSATVQVRSQTEGGLVSRDKQNVIEFMKPFQRRVG